MTAVDGGRVDDVDRYDETRHAGGGSEWAKRVAREEENLNYV